MSEITQAKPADAIIRLEINVTAIWKVILCWLRRIGILLFLVLIVYASWKVHDAICLTLVDAEMSGLREAAAREANLKLSELNVFIRNLQIVAANHQMHDITAGLNTMLKKNNEIKNILR